MSNPTCTRASFISSGACLKQFHATRRHALKVYLMSLQLTAIGGTAYTLGPAGTLNTAAAAYSTMNEEERDVARLVIESNNATAAGASVPATNVLLAAAIACLDNFTEPQLEAMELVLRCELGRAKAYPQ